MGASDASSDRDPDAASGGGGADASHNSGSEGIGVSEGRSTDIHPPNGGSPPLFRPPPPTPSPSPGPAPTPIPLPATEPPSPDVDLTPNASPMPGEHRGGFTRLPTGPVAATSTTAPIEPDGSVAAAEPVVQWLFPEPSRAHHGLAAWALAFSIAGLCVSLFVGWGFPIGLVGVVTAIVALRRPLESCSVAIWALVLGAVSVLYSSGWLLWAASRTNIVS